MRSLRRACSLMFLMFVLGSAIAYAQDGTSRVTPIPIGTAADVWDGKYTLRVVSFNIHRGGELMSRDDRNPPPGPGQIYAIVTLEVEYHGDDTSYGYAAGPFSYVDTGTVEIDDTVCGTSAMPVRLGDRNEEAKFYIDLFDGGVTRFSECVEVTPEEAANLYLYVPDGHSGDVFFALGAAVQSPSATPAATPRS